MDIDTGVKTCKSTDEIKIQNQKQREIQIEIQKITKRNRNTCRGADDVAEHEIASEAEEKDHAVEKSSSLPGFFYQRIILISIFLWAYKI